MPDLAIYHSSPDYPALTGREVRRTALLTRIVDAWNSGHQVVGVYGPAGIGKSVITLQAAAAFSTSHSKTTPTPLRVLWLELGIFPDAGGILSQIADCMDKMDFVSLARQIRATPQPALDTLASELRQALSANCLLIIDQTELVLDQSGRIPNSYLHEVLAVLIENTGWATLFTARRDQPPPIDLFDTPILWLALDELNADEGLTLLRNLLPSSSLQWEQLSTDDQQLILRTIAVHPYRCTLFLADPGDNPAATLAEIKNTPDGLLDYYLNRVPLVSRPMLELLAVIAGREQFPFLEGAWQTLGGILGWPVRQSRAALEDLIRRALVESSANGYRLLPFVRQHLTQRPPPLGISEGLARLFHFHLARLYDVLAYQVKNQAEALFAEDASRHTAELIYYHAVLRDRALRQALQRANLRLVRSALENLVEPTPWPWSASITAARGLTYTQQLVTLIELESPNPANPLEVGAAWHAVGHVCDTLHAPDQALDAYHQALSWWEHTQQPHRLGDAWAQMGAVFAQHHRWDEALQAYHNALDWWERTRQYRRMGGAWHHIGIIYAAQKDWRAALDAYRTALDWQGRTNRINESRTTWGKIAEAHEACGQREFAADAYAHAGEILPET